MLDKKLVRVNYYGSYYDVIGLERWLTEQAERGLKFAYFEEHTPVAWFWDEGSELNIRYLVAADVGRPSKESLRALEADCAANGWEEVYHKVRHFIVYASEDMFAIRPTWKLTEKEWRRRWWTMLNTVLLWLVMIGVIIWGAGWMLDPDRMRYYDLLTRAPWELLRNVSVPLTLALGEVTVFYDIIAWRKNWYDREAAPPWEPAWAIGVLGRKLAWAAWVVTILCFFGLLRYDNMDFHEPDSVDVKIEIPDVSLRTIEGDAYIGYAGDVGVDVGYRKGLLLPLEVQVTDWEDWTMGDGEFYYRGMTFTYYRLRNEKSALRLAEEERHDAALPLAAPCGFDAAWWVETDTREMPAFPLGTTVTIREQHLTAVADDVVITLHYEGSGDLTASLPELYRIVTAYRQQET